MKAKVSRALESHVGAPKKPEDPGAPGAAWPVRSCLCSLLLGGSQPGVATKCVIIHCPSSLTRPPLSSGPDGHGQEALSQPTVAQGWAKRRHGGPTSLFSQASRSPRFQVSNFTKELVCEGRIWHPRFIEASAHGLWATCPCHLKGRTEGAFKCILLSC